jgi:hypothetical protein
LKDSDTGVRDKYKSKEAVLVFTDREDDDKQDAEKKVERREDVRFEDLADCATRGIRNVVCSPVGKPFGDVGTAQSLQRCFHILISARCT